MLRPNQASKLNIWCAIFTFKYGYDGDDAGDPSAGYRSQG